jgi:hypothetical protein
MTEASCTSMVVAVLVAAVSSHVDGSVFSV